MIAEITTWQDVIMMAIGFGFGFMAFLVLIVLKSRG